MTDALTSATQTSSAVTRSRLCILATNIPILYFVLGLLGVLSLTLLTPPFQIFDEPRHFYRAFELSELSLRSVIRNGVAGEFLPSSLPKLSERFLGKTPSDDLSFNLKATLKVSPLRDTLRALAIPLEPQRREFVIYSNIPIYPPLPYLPQIAAIAVGRALGLGPLGLLYMARLLNGVVALLITATALRILPVGNIALFVLGLLPMTLFQFASASSDAGVISTAYLFTAIATRARFRGRWHKSEVLLACVTGTIFCSVKPVYAPLLVIGLPAALQRGLTSHVVAVHALLITVVLGVTALWLKYTLPTWIPSEGTNVSLQLAGIISHPGTFANIVFNAVQENGGTWLRSAIGRLGWLTIQLPTLMYAMPIAAVILCLLLRPRDAPKIGLMEALWQVLLLGMSAFLVLVGLYLSWTPVGADFIEGVQGRYFLPMLGLAAVTFCGVIPRFSWMLQPQIAPVVLLMVAAEVALTSVLVAQSFHVF